MRDQLHPIVPPGLVAAFYKGNRDGYAGVLSYLGRKLDHGPYSHTELVLPSGLSLSSSLPDGGVRAKLIRYSCPHKWDFLPLHDPDGTWTLGAMAWFEAHKDDKYDILGNLRFVTNFIPHSEDKQFCSEANMAMLGYPEPFRFGPSGMAVTLQHDFKTSIIKG